MLTTNRLLPYFLLILAAIITVSACNVNDSNSDPNNDEQLYNKFNGTWKPVHSISDQPIDANLDGQVSRSMLEELTNFKNGSLTIHINTHYSADTEYRYLFSLPYPVQEFPVDYKDGEPEYINYLLQPKGRLFKFSPDEQSITLQPDSASQINKKKYPFPESVEITDDNLMIKVTTEQRLYTADGWQTVEITTSYARISEST